MKRSEKLLFTLACLALVLYGIHVFDRNSVCYEILPPQGKFDTMLLDKCRGGTYIAVKEEFDRNQDGKVDGFTYRWTKMYINFEGEVAYSED